MSIVPGYCTDRRTKPYDPFSAEIWDPFSDYHLHPSPTTPPFSADTASFANARIQWKETLEAYVFWVELPGLKKEEVTVAVEDGRNLKISGERNLKIREEQLNDRWRRVERSRGKFMRAFRLPEDVKAKQLKVAIENGVLTVTVPKVGVNGLLEKAIDIAA